MLEVLATAVPAIVAAIVSLVTFFSTKNSKLMDKMDQIEEQQTKFEEKFDYEMAKQARTRILRFNNELMCGQNHTKEYFDDIIENSIDVYEKYYKDPNHQNLRNGIAKSAIKNIYRVYDLKIQSNSFLQYPKEEVIKHEGSPDNAGSADCQ